MLTPTDLSDLFVIAGPCVIESNGHARFMAAALKEITSRLGVPFIFKASYDKANRTSLDSYRGPGIDRGLEILADIRSYYSVPVLSDVHTEEQALRAKDYIDVIQIPAFLCRQTDLLLAAASTGEYINVKKGQFMAPWDMSHVVSKLVRSGFDLDRLMISERGASFGYNNLVVDFRSFRYLAANGCHVVFDVTHSVQSPGGLGAKSGGTPEDIPTLARAGAAVGVKGFFFEVHDNPSAALSDGANALHLNQFELVLGDILAIRRGLASRSEW